MMTPDNCGTAVCGHCGTLIPVPKESGLDGFVIACASAKSKEQK
jgi:hypothetical protein